ncbi:MAG: hypothetical protein IRY97_07320, partial [Thermomicrobiaceae bacterium]|nr:hypothetical protein [Thermomicrobiaceae bacterium]
MTRYRWIEPSPPDERAYGLVDHALLCAILAARGVGTPEEAETFLS